MKENRKRGQPTLYSELMNINAMVYLFEYKEQGDVIPSVAGLAVWLSVARSTIYEWGKVHPAFSDTLEAILAEQNRLALSGGISGAWSGPICKLVLSNHGMVERKQTDHVSSDGSMAPAPTIDATKLSSDTIKELLDARADE